MKTLRFFGFWFLLALSYSAPGWGTPFTAASENLPPLPEGTSSATVLLRLKQHAVKEFLKGTLGPRFERYAAQITPAFAEEYIEDYQVTRQSPDSSQMEIEGHLDSGALKEWIRTNETKATGSATLKPLLILSSNVPPFLADPRQTPSTVKQNPIGQTLFQRLNEVFQKFNTNLAVAEEPLDFNRPPTREADIRALRNSGNTGTFNSLVWVHFSPCKECGTRVEFVLYNLPQARQVQTISVDIDTPVQDLQDPKKLTKVLGKGLQDFSKAFEESVSKGTLFALEYRLVIEGIEASKAFKQLDSSLPKQDFVIQSSLVRGGQKTAEFKILSSLPPREFADRLQTLQLPGISLKPVRIDSQKVTMRYLN